MSRDPLVSIAMPIHNAARYLSEAIASILAQTYRHWELLCLDDGSTDDTASIVRRWAEADSRIRHIRLPHRGIVATLNHGIGMAAGTYLARMDADDVSLPDRLAMQLDWLERHPELAMVGTAYTVIDAGGTPGKTGRPPTCPADVRRELQSRNCLCHPSMMMRSSSIRAIPGPYREKFVLAEDYDLWLRAVESCSIGNVPHVGLHYRRDLSRTDPERTVIQTVSHLAAQISALARARQLPDPADHWPAADRHALRDEGVSDQDINRQIRRALLATARQASRQGFAEVTRRLVQATRPFTPRGEGLLRQLDWHCRRWRAHWGI